MDDERTYTKSEIRERRRVAAQWIALQQRQLDALAKLDEAADELDQVEREMADFAAGGADHEPASDVAEPQMTGERALLIMREAHPEMWLSARDIMTDMVRRGWSEDTDLALSSLRHSLRRLALRNEHVERKINGPKHFYRYTTRSDALIPVTRVSGLAVNGKAYPALQGGGQHY